MAALCCFNTPSERKLTLFAACVLVQGDLTDPAVINRIKSQRPTAAFSDADNRWHTNSQRTNVPELAVVSTRIP